MQSPDRLLAVPPLAPAPPPPSALLSGLVSWPNPLESTRNLGPPRRSIAQVRFMQIGLRQMARDPVAGLHFAQRRDVHATTIHHNGTSWMEGTPGRRIDGGGHITR